MSSNDPEGARRPSGTNPSYTDEMKKFKENLLQSVSSGNENSFISPTTLGDSSRDRSRSRSASRVRDNISLPKNVMEKLDPDKLCELKEAFLLFDLNGDGLIDLNDLRGTFVSLGETVDEGEIKGMMAEAPKPLDLEGFVTFLGCQTLELDKEEALVQAMSRWDKDGSGLIPEEKIRHDLMTWGDRFTAKEVDYALDEAPMVARGATFMIDYVTFCSILCGFRRK